MTDASARPNVVYYDMAPADADPLVRGVYTSRQPADVEAAVGAIEPQSAAWIGTHVIDLLRLLRWLSPISGYERACRRLSTLLARADLDTSAASIAKALADAPSDRARLLDGTLATAAYYADPVHDPLVVRIATAFGLPCAEYRFAAWLPPGAVSTHDEKAFAESVRRAIAELVGGADARPAWAARGVAELVERVLAAPVSDALQQPRLRSAAAFPLSLDGERWCALVTKGALPTVERDGIVDRILVALEPLGLLAETAALLCPDAESAARARMRFDPARSENQGIERSRAWLRLSLAAGSLQEVVARCEEMAKRSTSQTDWDTQSARAQAMERLGDLEGALELAGRHPPSLTTDTRVRLLLALGRPREAFVASGEPRVLTVARIEEVARTYGMTPNEVLDARLASASANDRSLDFLFDCALALGRVEAAIRLAQQHGLWSHIRTQLAQDRTIAPAAVLALRRSLLEADIERYGAERERLAYQKREHAYLEQLRKDYDLASELAQQIGENDSSLAWRAALASTAPIVITDALGITPRPEAPAREVTPPDPSAPPPRKRRIVQR